MDEAERWKEAPKSLLPMHKEATRFALGALFSYEIGSIFPSEENRKWVCEAITKFSKHLDLPGRVRTTYLEMASNPECSAIDSLVLAIQHSDELGGSCEPLIQVHKQSYIMYNSSSLNHGHRKFFHMESVMVRSIYKSFDSIPQVVVH
jgi:hypothetical protein